VRQREHRRLKWLDAASIPLKLRGILRPHEPRPFGPILKHLQPFRGHAGDGPTAYLSGLSPIPQATEQAQNGKADQRRTTDPASPLDSTRRLIQRLVRRRHDTWLGASIRLNRQGSRARRGPLQKARRVRWRRYQATSQVRTHLSPTRRLIRALQLHQPRNIDPVSEAAPAMRRIAKAALRRKARLSS
jgi:hypothetical protein